MMYAVFLVCLMMTVPCVLTGRKCCQRKSGTGGPSTGGPVICPPFVADATCDPGFHEFTEGSCVQVCDGDIYGFTYQQYIGVDVDSCSLGLLQINTVADVCECQDRCEAEFGFCMSGSYNSATGACRISACDPLGEALNSNIAASASFNTNAGPSVAYFVRNCA